MSLFRCRDCGTPVSLPRSSVSTFSCQRCGEVYWTDSRKPMYPALRMSPVGTPGGVPSKWMPTHTRPVRPGIYEVRFRHLGDSVLALSWTGSRFVREGRPVRTVDLLTWRGWLT